MDFFEVILVARRKQNLSRIQLARTVGVSRVTVWRWEMGLQQPSNIVRPILAGVLDVDPESLRDPTRRGWGRPPRGAA
jgi:transcriptional regulator with XRE-family HTH domain